MSAVADLSVVMPTYNHARYLPRALDALLSQSVRPRELIVVNDASPDETAEILERYARSDPAVKVIRNETNRGVTACIGIGIAQASGKYLFCASSDDYVLPGFIGKTIGALEQYPQAGLCSSYFSFVNGVTGEILENASGWCDAPRYFEPREVERLVGHTSIPGHATIMKRSSFDAAGGFLSDLAWHSDWFFNYVIAFREGLCHVPEVLSLQTVTQSSYSVQGVYSERQLAVIGAIFDRLASAEYADLAPVFQRSGVFSVLGTPALVAAAGRADAWSRATLKLVNGFTPEQYESLLDHPDENVRELATFFLGTFWHEVKPARQHERDERRRVEQELAAVQLQRAELQLQLAELQRRTAQTEEALEHAKRRGRETEAELDRTSRLLVEREAQLRHMEGVAGQYLDTIRRMESSYFWKSRKLLAGCKHKMLKPIGRLARRAACW